jgi:DNA-binding response OmpR family regulator
LMIVDRMLPGFSGEELCVCPRAERRSHHHADRA